MKRLIYIIILAIFLLAEVAIAEGSEFSYSYNDDDYREIYDPYEKVNRKIFAFNNFLDKIALRPVARGYKNITNDYTRARIGNFLENISVPLTIVNYTLQGRFVHANKSFWRFFVNTVFGIVGMFDVASKIGIAINYQTFGSTMAYYGVCSGPYIVIPFIGSTSVRDMLDTVPLDTLLNPIKYHMSNSTQISLFSMQFLHDRMNVLVFTDFVDKSSSDKYIAVRSAIHQNREYNIEYPKGLVCGKTRLNK